MESKWVIAIVFYFRQINYKKDSLVAVFTWTFGFTVRAFLFLLDIFCCLHGLQTIEKLRLQGIHGRWSSTIIWGLLNWNWWFCNWLNNLRLLWLFLWLSKHNWFSIVFSISIFLNNIKITCLLLIYRGWFGLFLNFSRFSASRFKLRSCCS